MKRTILISTIAGGLIAIQVAGVSAFQAMESGPKGGTPAAGRPADLATEMTVPVKIPLYSTLFDQVPIATVNEERITMQEFTRFLENVHEGMGEEKKAKRQKLADVLNRMINLRLLIQEGRTMELDQQPDVKEIADTYARQQLREMLLKQAVDNVVPDAKQVEKRYRAKAAEYRITSLLFNKEEEAKKAGEELKKGVSFAALLEKSVKEGLAEGKAGGESLKSSDLHPEMVKMIAAMKAGDQSKVVPLTKGYLLFRLEEVRHVENAQLKEQAEKEVLSEGRLKALHDYRDKLIKKHVTLKKDLLKKLDFEAAKPGFAKMQKDTRPVAEIKGDKPVTVADLAEAISAKFFHGVDLAVKENKVNKLKEELLNEILAKRVFDKEARVLGIDKSEAYLRKVRENVDSLVFGTFVEKVIRPEVKVAEEEVKASYTTRLAEFTYPEMLKIRTIAFKSLPEAEAAVDKLRKGMDFKWFTDNAAGKVDPETPELMRFDEGAVITNSLPEGLQKALAGVRQEDYRLYTDDKGYSYVLFVPEVIPSRAQELKEVEEDIRKTIFFEKLNSQVEEWSQKLRAASDIRIYADLAH